MGITVDALYSTDTVVSFIFPIAPSSGEKLFDDYGVVTILFARIVFGMRVIAGPMAGVLRMPWRKFAIYNFLGAAW